jgi:hypothetical protein
MATSVMGDYPESLVEEKHHLAIPVVATKWPPMMKDNGLSFSPILVENFSAILYFNPFHFLSFKW